MQPRDLIAGFGTPEAVGQPGRGQRPIEVAAAWFQHQLVCNVRSYLRSSELNDVDLAAALSEKPDTLSRKLRGEYPVTRDDIFALALTLGAAVIPQPTDANLFPPEYARWLPVGWRAGALRLLQFDEPARLHGASIDWVKFVDAAEQADAARSLRRLAHLADDATLRTDLIDYLVRNHADPDLLFVGGVGGVPALFFGLPSETIAGCVRIPDGGANTEPVTRALCRVIALIHGLAEPSVSAVPRYAVLSLPRAATQVLTDWYPNLHGASKGSTVTLAASHIAPKLAAPQLESISVLEPVDLEVTVMTRKPRQGRDGRAVAVWRIESLPRRPALTVA